MEKITINDIILETVSKKIGDRCYWYYDTDKIRLIDIEMEIQRCYEQEVLDLINKLDPTYRKIVIEIENLKEIYGGSF